MNDGFDNEDSDYILYVNDVLGPEEKSRYVSSHSLSLNEIKGRRRREEEK